MNQILRPFALLLLVLAVLVGYFWIHKPFSPALAVSIVGLVADLFTVGAFITLTGGVGWQFLHLLGVEPSSRLEHAALASLVGMGGYSLIVLLLGLIGLYVAPVLWGVLILLGAFSYRGLFAWLAHLHYALNRAITPPNNRTRILAIVSWIALITAALFAFAPPVAWDAVAYHLVGPQRYLASGQVTAHPDNFYLGLSQGVEVLYGVLMGLFGRDTVAAPLHMWFGLMTLLTLAGLTRRYTNAFAGWMAVTLPLTSFSLWMLMGYAYVDLAVMSYSAGLLVALIHWREANHPRWLILAGIFIGLVLGVKYFAGILALVAVVYVVVRSRNQHTSLQLIVLMSVVALLVFLPWFIKGLLLYDNPIYPVLMDGLNWDSTRTGFVNPTNTGLLKRGEGWQLPFMPFAATIFGVEGGDGFGFTTGIWLLTAPFLLIFTGRYLKPETRTLAWDSVLYAAPLILYWMVMGALYEIHLQTRLMTMLFPPFIVAGALAFYGLAQWPKKPLDINFIVWAVFVMTLVLGTFENVRQATGNNALDYHILTNVGRDQYILNNGLVGAGYNAIQSIKRLQTEGKLPEHINLKMLFEVKGYYCPDSMTCDADVLIDHWRHPMTLGQTPNVVFQSWRDSGTDFVLLWHDGLEFMQRELPERYPGIDLFLPALDKWMTPIWTDDNTYYTLYGWQ